MRMAFRELPSVGDGRGHIRAEPVKILTDVTETTMSHIVKHRSKAKIKHHVLIECPLAAAVLVVFVYSISQATRLAQNPQSVVKSRMVASGEDVMNKSGLSNLAKTLQQRKVEDSDFPVIQANGPPQGIMYDLGVSGQLRCVFRITDVLSSERFNLILEGLYSGTRGLLSRSSSCHTPPFSHEQLWR